MDQPLRFSIHDLHKADWIQHNSREIANVVLLELECRKFTEATDMLAALSVIFSHVSASVLYRCEPKRTETHREWLSGLWPMLEAHVMHLVEKLQHEERHRKI